MENIFIKAKDHNRFTWDSLGNIKEGRGSLGEEVPVLVYRLMQFTLWEALADELGRDQADHYMRKAGKIAGAEFAKNVLNLDASFDDFVANLQKKLQEFKIGILRLESIDTHGKEIIMTVGEDLDCSGMPITDETVCCYDEGFIAAILQVYTGHPYSVREIDCWASGDRTCRFKCNLEQTTL